jgi:2-polyprenyl-3-methyl-5-hydroxy-6-metoxy-1,4-benzoquinol methylase
MVEVVATYHDRVRFDVFGVVPENAGRGLDLGGGVGATGAALKSSGRATRTVLVDQVADTIAAGVDEAFAGNLEDASLIDRVVAEAGPFDTILCLDILEHLRDPWSVVRSLHNALAPGGAMVISVPNLNHFSVVGPLVFKDQFQLKDAGILDRTHLRWFTRHGAVELATCSGLACEKVQSNIFSRRDRLLGYLTFGLLNRFLALQYVVRVRRKD